MNKKLLFNDNWKFKKTEIDAEKPEAEEFKSVDIPHDWCIYDTKNLYQDSTGWYKNEFEYQNDAAEVLLYFEGVYMDSTLFVNGQKAGEWKYGYSSFEHNITSYLMQGNNQILLKVNYQTPNSRWYSGAGIYRNVYLKKRSKNKIKTHGIYISSERIEPRKWQLIIDTELELKEEAFLKQELYKDDKLITAKENQINLYGVGKRRQLLEVEAPELWSPEKPEIYKLKTTLSKKTDIGEEIIEIRENNTGFKKVELDPDKGFIINDKQKKLYGVCEHHDLGALGAAFNKNALQRRLKLLKEMGVNAVRTAHNMPAKGFMELADEMGFLIVSESFDMWERPKTKFDYSRFFNDWNYKDIKNWVKRDRNHPSLLMWSIGNEIYDTHAGQQGQDITRMLKEYVLEFDPRQNARVTIGSNYMPWENAQKSADILKVIGYNYAEKYYEQHHKEHSDWVIYGSETASVVQSRGVSHFPYNKSILADDDLQCSSLGNSSTSWGSNSPEDNITLDRDTKFSLGQFIWTGFDYLGEPTPYHTKNSYFGQLDTATFKKDTYYIYQAAWTDYKEHPMIHIFPYWDFNPGQIIDLRVVSNAPHVTVEVNGKKIGEKVIDHRNDKEFGATFKVPFEAGKIKAVAYDKNGNVIAQEIRKTFSDPTALQIEADKKELRADGRDLIFAEINVVDTDDIVVENANNRVQVEVEGAGRLIGLDNGDSTDYDQYKGLSRRMFNGKLMVIISSRLKPGKIKLKVSSRGLKKAEAEFKVLPVVEKEKTGISAQEENQKRKLNLGNEKEIPIRKIELKTEEKRVFRPGKEEMIVKAKLCPENSNYNDLEWKVVTDTGIESNLAELEKVTDDKVKIKALGDGEFRLRVVSNNGAEHIRIISEIEFKAEDLGTAYKNPYTLVSAGLYDYTKGEIGSGNERGIATARDGETQVGFKDIDFGYNGAKKIILPIFALDNREYEIEIWEGIPHRKNSELLDKVIYQKESKWNVYQEENYQLPKKLRGIKTITFVLNDKIHLKGFYFKKENRAYKKNYAVDCDHIYGDSYRLMNKKVESIGNNVSLEYKDIDFGDQGTAKIRICGHSPIDKNTIQLKIESEKETKKEMIEFKETDDYQEKEFKIDKITGKANITFIFLPGSNFDFHYFKFIGTK